MIDVRRKELEVAVPVGRWPRRDMMVSLSCKSSLPVSSRRVASAYEVLSLSVGVKLLAAHQIIVC